MGRKKLAVKAVTSSLPLSTIDDIAALAEKLSIPRSHVIVLALTFMQRAMEENSETLQEVMQSGGVYKSAATQRAKERRKAASFARTLATLTPGDTMSEHETLSA